MGAGRITRQ